MEYVEVRALDVSAFDPVGVNQNKLRFLEAFLALCLLRGSEPISRGEQEALDANHLIVARRGREPYLKLNREGRDVLMADWARELLDSMQGVCEMLDHGESARPYSSALEQQRAKSMTSSGRRPPECSRRCARPASPSFSWRYACPKQHKDYFLGLYPPDESRLAEFAMEARIASCATPHRRCRQHEF